MAFSIEQIDSERREFGDYRYRIYRDGCLIACYWHDYRGDEHGIEFLDGRSETCPVGQMIDFITGGGPQPLGLSKQAVAYLMEMVAQDPPQ